MYTGILVFHVIVCVLLTTIVLLQFGKGAEVGAVMGGSGGASQNIFSSSSRGNFFTKLTSVLAVCFMATSISLTVMKTNAKDQSIFDNEAPVAAPLNSDQIQTNEVTEQSEETKAQANEATTEATKGDQEASEATETKEQNALPETK